MSPTVTFTLMVYVTMIIATCALPAKKGDDWNEIVPETLMSEKSKSSVLVESATGPAQNAGNPTRMPWTKKCVDGEIKAYVDGTNGKDWKSYDGSEGKPYKTIQQAVTKFTGTCTTIYIKAGTYTNKGYKGNAKKNKNNSNKLVNMDGVTDLIIRNYGGEDGTGIGGDHVVLKFDGPGGLIGGSAKDDSKKVTDFEIYGLEIEGPNQDITYADAFADRSKASKYYTGRGIAIWKGQNIHIHHMVVHDTPAGGIRVDNSDYVVIEDSEVYHCTWWANSAESAVVLAQSVNVDDDEGIKMMLRNNIVYKNMNKIPYYNKKYEWDYSPIGGLTCGDYAACKTENTDGCAGGSGTCECPWQCRYGKISQDYIVDGMGVYVTRNSDTYLKGQMELSGNTAYGNGINGLVFHRTFRGIVKKNIIYDNGEVPKNGHDEAEKEATDWKAPLSKTRQPYSGLVLNNADGVKLFGNKVRARYDDDFAYTMENDSGNDYKPKRGGGNKNCRGKVDDLIASYVADATADDCAAWFPTN